MSDINTISFDLSLNVDGQPLKGTLYTLNSVKIEGTDDLRPMSIGELVMAVCLSRATELEDAIFTLMEDVNNTTENLEALSALETNLVNNKDTGYILSNEEFNLLQVLDIEVASRTLDASAVTALIVDVEAKMDSLNSFSQETMIELQSQTNKRDQCYEMISNILKIFNTQLTGTANNI